LVHQTELKPKSRKAKEPQPSKGYDIELQLPCLFFLVFFICQTPQMLIHHWAQDGTPVPIGYTIMSMMREYIETSLAEQVTVMCSTSVSRLLWNVDDESGRKSVHGVVYKRDVCAGIRSVHIVTKQLTVTRPHQHPLPAAIKHISPELAEAMAVWALTRNVYVFHLTPLQLGI
jgi:hypothetical protein